MKFVNSRRETQTRKPLENEYYETWFHDEKTRLHMAEDSFLITKTAMRKRSLSVFWWPKRSRSFIHKH